MLVYVGAIRLYESDSKKTVTLELDMPGSRIVKATGKNVEEATIKVGKRILQDAGYQYVDLND